MPRLFPYEQQTRVSGAGLGPGPVDRTSGVNALGGAVNQFIAVRQEEAERDAALWATTKLSEAQSTWAEQLRERQQSAADGAPDFALGVGKDYDEYAQELAQQAPTRTSRDFLRARLAAFREGLVDHASRFEATERAAFTVRQSEELIDVGATLTFQSPDAFPGLLAERLALFESMRLEPQVRRDLADKAQRDMAVNAIRGMAETDPGGAFELLAAPAGSSGVLAVDALRADDRLQLMEYAQRKALSDADRSFRDAERAEAALADEASKDGDELMRAGRLTPLWIEENRDRLSPSDYRYFNRALSVDGEAPVNPVAYAELREA